jgi:hypothetical protein
VAFFVFLPFHSLCEFVPEMLGEFLNLLQPLDYVLWKHTFPDAVDVRRDGLGDPGEFVSLLLEF